MKTLNDKNIDIVRKGYELAASPYREGKDILQHEILLFKKWLADSSNTNMLEIGCASGFPIGKSILDSGKKYIGIDLSEKQINLAHDQYPEWKDNFIQSEMLEYCTKQGDLTFTGIISMFSIRHLPRIYHVALYTQLYRILKEEGKLLIDCSEYIDRGSTHTWLGGSTMYWSGFSKEWTLLTLKEIGFNLIEMQEDTKLFESEPETTLFMLFEK